MSLRQCMAAVDSFEFAEWLAFWELEAEAMGLIEHEPTPEELEDKLMDWAAVHNAKLAAKGR